MFKYNLRRFYHNINMYLVILIAITATLTIISIGVSFFYNTIEKSEDITQGNMKYKKKIQVYPIEGNKIEKSELEKILNKYKKNVELKITGIDEMWDEPESSVKHQVLITPIIFEKLPEWRPNIINGRYFDKNDLEEKNVVIGSTLAEKLFNGVIDEKSYVKVGNDNFKVIGVTDNQMYLATILIPFKYIPPIYLESRGEIVVSMSKNSEKPTKECVEFIKDINSTNKMEALEINLNSVEESFLNIGMIMTMIIMIIIITLINILSAYKTLLLRRKKEFIISRLLGLKDINIFKQIFFEINVVSIVSLIISIVPQKILISRLNIILATDFDMSMFYFSYKNLVYCFISIVLLNLIISFIGLKYIKKFNISEEIKVI